MPSRDRFSVTLAGQTEALIPPSRTPFFDAARQLLKLGYPADTVLVMTHAGSEIESLRATVGAAARLTVKEKVAGSGPTFAVWTAYVPSPVAPPKASKFIAAGGVAALPEERILEATGDNSGSVSNRDVHEGMGER